MNQQPPEHGDEDALAEIIRRIVRVAAPERIVLFGSAARGEAGPDSDLDLLVIKPGHYHRGRVTDAIYRSLIGVGRRWTWWWSRRRTSSGTGMPGGW